MVILHFDPGPNKLRMVKAIKETLHLSLKEAKDSVDFCSVECEKEQENAVIKAIESAGGKLK